MTKEEMKIYQQERYKKNKEKIRLKGIVYREENKEEIKIRGKKYRQSKKEQGINLHKIYRDKNKEKERIRNKKYRDNNKEKIKIRSKKYRDENSEKIKDYRKNNKEKIEEKVKIRLDNKRKNDPLYKLSLIIRWSIRGAFRYSEHKKVTKTTEILGCSFDFFKSYIENKFEHWMNWDNHGKYNGELNFGWDLDHIIPICSAKTEKELIALNHYTNFQPLCSKINRYIKKDSVPTSIK